MLVKTFDSTTEQDQPRERESEAATAPLRVPAPRTIRTLGRLASRSGDPLHLGAA